MRMTTLRRRSRRRAVDLAVLIAALTIWFVSYEASAQCPSLSPGVCSTNANCNGGTCDRGVCRNCPAGKIGELCQASDTFLNLGSVVVTQAGLDVAPIQYFKPLNDAYNQAKAAGLSATAYVGACTEVDGSSFKSYRVDIAALTASNFIKSDLLQDTVKFEIIPGGLRASATGDYQISKMKLDLWGGAFCCPCTGSCTSFTCPQVCSKSRSDDWIDFTFKATVSADIMMSFSPGVQGVATSVQNVGLAFDDNSLGASLHCPTSSYQLISNTVKSYFEQMKSSIAPTLLPGLTTAFTNAANIVALRYQGVQSYVPAAGVSLLYKVVNLTIATSKYIAADVQAKIIYTQFYNSSASCQINVTYADTSPDRTLPPPNTWSPLTKVLSPSGLYSPILAGSRFTRSFFNAVAWASFQDPTKRRRNFTFSASNGVAVTTDFQMSVPYFKIPNDGQQGRLRVSVNGHAQMSCTPTKQGIVLGADFSQLDSSFQLRYDNTPPDPSIAFQVVPGVFGLGSVSGIVSQDPTLNNAALLQSAMVGAMNFKVSTLDQFLLQKGNGVLTLPPDLQSTFPVAQLQIVSQGSAGGVAINNESGYIEMINRCACSSSSTALTGQGVDGTVEICPFSLLSKSYCNDVNRRRRRRVSSSDDSNKNENGLVKGVQELKTPMIANQGGDLMPAIGERSSSSAGIVSSLGDEDVGPDWRQLSTPQQEADLTTVLGSLATQCVTNAPTMPPTTAAPTRLPTRKPTKLPTTFQGVALAADACQEKNGCFYSRDVLFFVCKSGYAEVLACRNENNDVYCCPDLLVSSSAVSQGTNLAMFWVVIALWSSLLLL